MKIKSDLRGEILDNLRRKTGININQEGSVAVAIVDALVEEMILLYREIERVQSQAYLSTSSGNYTQLIAELLDVQRREGESESEFKLRTSNKVYSAAKGNTIAIQEAIWSVPGVASYDIVRYSRGTGSFTVYIYPERNANQSRIIDQVRTAVSQVVSEGIRFEVKAPEETKVDISIIVQFSNNLSVVQKQDIRNSIRSRIISYINSTTTNSNIYINEIIERVMNTNSDIIDMSINSIKLNDKSVNISNIFGDKDTRYSAGTIEVV